MNDQIDNSDEIIIENLDEIPESETRDISNISSSKTLNGFRLTFIDDDPDYIPKEMHVSHLCEMITKNYIKYNNIFINKN